MQPEARASLRSNIIIINFLAKMVGIGRKQLRLT